MNAPNDASATHAPGLLHPLRYGAFASIAGATLISNVGVWMRDTTSAWTVAGESPHRSSVALVQAATALPTFLLALPAGVLADHFDRRRILLWCQVVLAGAGVALAALSYGQVLTVGAVLFVALVAGSAAAIAAPAFQAIVPSLVPSADIRAAVALSSVSFNIARVIGPAAGGVLIATVGPAAAYAGNAAGYAVTILVLLMTGRAAAMQTDRLPIDFRAELHDGLAYVAKSPGFRRVLARGMGLYVCASCYLALTPTIAHDVLGKSAGIYGALLAATGIGSIVGGVVLSLVKQRGLDDDRLLASASAASAVALAVLAYADGPLLACGALALAGGATLIQLATLNAAAQLLLPDAIRGRGLAVYMAATFGCMAVGSLLWGAVADTFSIAAALATGAFGFVIAALGARLGPLAAERP